MKKWIFLLVSGLLFALPVAAQQKMVFSTIQGLPITEFGERILKEVYQQLNMDVGVEFYPGERSLIAANTGKTDGELARIKGIEKEYPNLIMIPVPLTELSLAAFSNQALNITTFDDLKKYRIGFVGGTKILNQMTAGFPHVLRVNHPDQLFDMLLLGRVDVVIDTYEDGLVILQSEKYQQVKIINASLLKYPVFHYVNKKHAKLVPAISKIFEKMRDKGVLQKRREEFAAEIAKQPSH